MTDLTQAGLRTDIIAAFERDAHGRNKAIQQSALSPGQVKALAKHPYNIKEPVYRPAKDVP